MPPRRATYWKKRLEQELVEWRTEGQHPYEFAELFAQAGQEAHALDWLERACREHDFMLVYVRVAPNLAPLRATSPLPGDTAPRLSDVNPNWRRPIRVRRRSARRSAALSIPSAAGRW